MNRVLRIGSLIVFGVTGPCAERANGLYEPSGETSNDHPVYVKKGQKQFSLCINENKCWAFRSYAFGQESLVLLSRSMDLRDTKASSVVILGLNILEYFVPLIILARIGTINALIARNILLSIFGEQFQIVQVFDHFLYI